MTQFEVDEDRVYTAEGPVNLNRITTIYGLVNRPELKDRPFNPLEVNLPAEPDRFFESLRARDVLLHHPYESFNTVIDFIRMAVRDPRVLAIKQTLYRTGEDSEVVQALMEAAEQGKEVAVLVELKARFDEAFNIEWGQEAGGERRPRRLRPAGHEDPLQALHGGAPRRGPAAPLRPPGHRQLQPRDGAVVHGPGPAHRPRGHDPRGGGGLQPAHGALGGDLPQAPGGAHDDDVRLPAPHRPGDRARPRRPAGGDRGQDERPHRRQDHPRPLPRLHGRRRDRPRGARHLLPAAGPARHQRAHPRAQHHRPLPGAQPRVLLRQRRRSRDLDRQRRLDEPQPAQPRGGRLPGGGGGHQGAPAPLPAAVPGGPLQDEGLPLRRQLRAPGAAERGARPLHAGGADGDRPRRGSGGRSCRPWRAGTAPSGDAVVGSAA